MRSNRSNHLIRLLFVYQSQRLLRLLRTCQWLLQRLLQQLETYRAIAMARVKGPPGSPSMSQSWRNVARIGRRMGQTLQVRFKLTSTLGSTSHFDCALQKRSLQHIYVKSLRTVHDKHARKHLSLWLSTPEVKHASKYLRTKI